MIVNSMRTGYMRAGFHLSVFYEATDASSGTEHVVCPFYGSPGCYNRVVTSPEIRGIKHDTHHLISRWV